MRRFNLSAWAVKHPALILFLIVITTISVVVPLLIPGPWLDAHRWIDGTKLGLVGGTLVGYVVMEGVVYAWHRSAHNVGFLWRGFHQVHHSPRRVDIPGQLTLIGGLFFVAALLRLSDARIEDALGQYLSDPKPQGAFRRPDPLLSSRAFGHPEWGPFLLGKTNPHFSTSGLSAASAFTSSGR